MRVSYAPGVFWDRVDGRTVVCHEPSGEVYELNATGGRLWAECSDAPVGALVDVLAAAYPATSREDLARDVEVFLTSLRDRGLLVVAGEG